MTLKRAPYKMGFTAPLNNCIIRSKHKKFEKNQTRLLFLKNHLEKSSYVHSRIFQFLKMFFADTVPDISTFSTHSAKSGEATLAAGSDIFGKESSAPWSLGFSHSEEHLCLRFLLLAVSNFLRLSLCELKLYSFNFLS